MHNRLCSSPLPNAFSLCLPVPTNLHISFWRSALTSYHDSEIVDFLEFGWPINYSSLQLPHPASHNHLSACKYASSVKAFISKKVALHATASPFQSNPFACQLMTSPLLTVPKKGSDSRRVVMDLSFPPNHSVNDGIPSHSYLGEPFHLRLPGVDSLDTFIHRFGQGCMLFKTDLSRAYRQLPVDPRDYHFLGYEFDNLLFLIPPLPSAFILQS